MPKRALLVGIDDYDFAPALKGCVNDAAKLAELLGTHYDGSPNFGCKLLLSSEQRVTEAVLHQAIREAFSSFNGDVLIYFSGHGVTDELGGHLVTQEGKRGDYGVRMDDLIVWARKARSEGVQSVLIILDCCHAGAVGDSPIEAGLTPLAKIPDGVTILAGSRPDEPALMSGGASVFTELLAGGLSGGAANVLGQVTAASLYGFIEASLGVWDQRPVYKSHAQRLEPVRRCAPMVETEVLRKLCVYFQEPDYRFQLDEDYEDYRIDPDHPDDGSGLPAVIKEPGDPEKKKIREEFKRCQVAGLLRPEAGDDLFWAAVRSEHVVLTPLGKFYRQLAALGRI